MFTFKGRFEAYSLSEAASMGEMFVKNTVRIADIHSVTVKYARTNVDIKQDEIPFDVTVKFY